MLKRIQHTGFKATSEVRQLCGVLFPRGHWYAPEGRGVDHISEKMSNNIHKRPDCFVHNS
ncbi:MAG TPA: hypothetical protein PKC72_16835 [Chitinophagaceae bacterium]|nr:hypothetical protein [Chitinophagaceae bacterium]